MDNNKLIDLLTIFKQSREKLSFDFISEDIEIFEPMFKLPFITPSLKSKSFIL